MSTPSDGSCLNAVYRKNIFTIALINARSLIHKLNSFEDTMNELGSDVCLLTETWFKNSNRIKNELEDFKNKTGYNFIRRDRAGLKRGGGVAICYNSERIQMSHAKLPPSKHEVLATIGRRVGQRRKIVCIVVYIPPHYNAEQNRSLFRLSLIHI